MTATKLQGNRVAYVTGVSGRRRKPLSLNLPLRGVSRKVKGASWLAVRTRVITSPDWVPTTVFTCTAGMAQFFGLLGKKKFLWV